MNQDFALLATPANARRLQVFQRVCKIDLPASIEALAAEDRIDESAFDSMVCPCDSVKLMITQFLLDCDLRGAIQTAYHPEFHPIALLNAVRLAKPDLVIVATNRRRIWQSASIAVNLPIRQIADPSSYTVEGSLASVDRHATVIYDVDHITTPAMRYLSREFARTIIYEHRELSHVMPWPFWARMLFPGMPHPLMPRLIKDVPSDWLKQPLAAFAVLYNVCLFPYLIDTPSIVAALEDDVLIERCKYNSLLTL